MASAMAGLRLFGVRYLDVRPPAGRTGAARTFDGAGLPRLLPPMYQGLARRPPS